MNKKKMLSYLYHVQTMLQKILNINNGNFSIYLWQKKLCLCLTQFYEGIQRHGGKLHILLALALHSKLSASVYTHCEKAFYTHLMVWAGLSCKAHNWHFNDWAVPCKFKYHSTYWTYFEYIQTEILLCNKFVSIALRVLECNVKGTLCLRV
jgi:hypothetical protein